MRPPRKRRVCRPLAEFVALSLLTACSSSISGTTYTDGRFWYSNVKSASDIAGGPRQDLLVIVDSLTGQVVDRSIAAGPGTLQALSGVVTASITAGGDVAGHALLRPARNSTSATIQGGSNTTSTTQSTTSNTTSNTNSNTP